MTFEIFMFGLLVVSVLTGLFTEAIKGWLSERGKKFYCNALAGYVAAAVSVLVSVGYLIITETAFNLKMAVYLIALVLLSWLAAMVGYDKVIQSITQFKKGLDHGTYWKRYSGKNLEFFDRRRAEQHGAAGLMGNLKRNPD